jgi:glycosyltransferase involved in cell wall biosynthesis
MKILTAHNFYQHPGGEDNVFHAESELLRDNGHEVVQFTDSNHRISNGLISGAAAVWNQSSYSRLRDFARSHRPAVAHFHNTFPLISPAAYYAMRREYVPVIQTLSNYRLICPGGLLMRDGRPCEDCITSNSLRPANLHRCYRNSRAATTAVSTMLIAHRALRTWKRAVDLYIALSRFARHKFTVSGFPEKRVIVKPNFIHPDPGPGDGSGNYALFVGRLADEKGIRTLAEAWHNLPDIPLTIAGDGPLNSVDFPPNVTRLGHQPRERIIELMKNAAVLIFPSTWYECAPLTILEAFACGLPVIASDIGSIPEFVDPYRTGLLFTPGDPYDLIHHVRWAFEKPNQLRAMRAAARREFETKYTAETNYKQLIEIYQLAIENAKLAPGRRSLVPAT